MLLKPLEIRVFPRWIVSELEESDFSMRLHKSNISLIMISFEGPEAELLFSSFTISRYFVIKFAWASSNKALSDGICLSMLIEADNPCSADLRYHFKASSSSLRFSIHSRQN